MTVTNRDIFVVLLNICLFLVYELSITDNANKPNTYELVVRHATMLLCVPLSN